MNQRQREGLIRQHLIDRGLVLCTIKPRHDLVRMDIEQRGTVMFLRFSAPLPVTLPRPFSGKTLIPVNEVQRVTLVNGTMYLHFNDFEIEVPPAINNGRLTLHRLPDNGRSAHPSYTDIRLSSPRR